MWLDQTTGRGAIVGRHMQRPAPQRTVQPLPQHHAVHRVESGLEARERRVGLAAEFVIEPLHQPHGVEVAAHEEVNAVLFDALVGATRGRALAADDRAFFLKVRDVVEAAVSETTFRQIALKMQKTREIPLTGDPVNAVTHYSQEVTDYDRATDFEALGGKLIELPASDWREMVTAG